MSLTNFFTVLASYMAFIFLFITRSYVKGNDWKKDKKKFLDNTIDLILYFATLFGIGSLLFGVFYILYIFLNSFTESILDKVKIGIILLFVLKAIWDLYYYFFKKNNRFINKILNIFSPIVMYIYIGILVVLAFFTEFLVDVFYSHTAYIIRGYLGKYVFNFMAIILFGFALYKMISLVTNMYVCFIDKIFLKFKFMKSLKKFVPGISFLIWIPIIYLIRNIDL